MRELVLCHLRRVRQRRLAVPLLAVLGCGLPALAGMITGDPMLSGGALGVLSAALPPALLYAFASEPPEVSGPGDDPGGGGPDDPPEPDGRGGDSGLDWPAFDARRRDWERTPART